MVNPRKTVSKLIATAIASASVLTIASTASAASLKITVENLAPQGGTLVTPLWFGLHDGTFDPFNEGQALLIPSFERLVEDGLTAPISASFAASGAGTVQGTVFGGLERPVAPISPGATVSTIINIDDSILNTPYFSYAAMVIPSNDAFFANDDPFEHRLFDAQGNFIATSFEIFGSEVYDAGTEVNDENPINTAFLQQPAPNTGTTEGGVVRIHDGFRPAGTGGVLDASRPFRGQTINFANADFKAPGYRVARITIERVPEPSTLAILPLTALFLLFGKARRLRSKVS
ncbi:spondin domain-containing protein [Nostoc sp. PCC 7107]|uniref:spondin domain-containing protein n=1 Tax=Nostoc sp. PCC 7107 TaxID=317936 RepID=UPI00029ED5AE|nr:spondin domain-containing protein [Nostoc sp. PCC 7107]AFY41643.1 PEP motif putative anchor domain protein [Nostoc sp. PCC 7107]